MTTRHTNLKELDRRRRAEAKRERMKQRRIEKRQGNKTDSIEPSENPQCAGPAK